jgi:hypothetical protein
MDRFAGQDKGKFLSASLILVPLNECQGGKYPGSTDDMSCQSLGLVARTLDRGHRARPGRQFQLQVEGELNESMRWSLGWSGRGRGEAWTGDVLSA